MDGWMSGEGYCESNNDGQMGEVRCCKEGGESKVVVVVGGGDNVQTNCSGEKWIVNEAQQGRTCTKKIVKSAVGQQWILRELHNELWLLLL
mmetsp:Transcript_7385/g.27587  ORF Transcript_7385/g.27587 Transcript_7385/m.27587 type:complete len:91 (+) Transcript_7385:3703-3975(+)